MIIIKLAIPSLKLQLCIEFVGKINIMIRA